MVKKLKAFYENKIFQSIAIILLVAILMIILKCALSSSNRIDTLPNEVILCDMTLSEMQEYIEENLITSEDITKIELRNITDIDIENLKCFENLNELIIDGCTIETLNGIEKFSRLKVLKINDTNIAGVEEILSKLPCVETFIATNCRILGKINLGESKSIKEVILDNNFITKIDFNAPNLEKFSIKNNKIRNVDQFLKFVKLKELKLSGNPINNLEKISELKELELLDIRNTNIGEYCPEIESIKNLNTIYLSDKYDRNRIRFILNNFKDGDVKTKQFVLKERYQLQIP